MRRSLFVLVSLVASSLLSFARSTAPAQFGGDEASSAWTAVVSDEIRRAEYFFHALTAEPAVVSAPNRSHELRSRVSAAGLEVFPRATSADGDRAEWKLALRTVSFGRVSADHGALEVHDLGDARVATHGNRVELEHGLLTEWFVNDERGIEQGWTISERPRGVEPLWIGLEFGGDLSLRIEDGGRSGVLVDACGDAKLRYRDLIVFDATGRELVARIVPSQTGVGIRVDDTNAVYPVTVDPLLTGPAWTAESDQAGASYGFAVATAGDVNGDGFSDVIVGARNYDNGQSNEGRAFVYLGSATGLSASPSWTAESDQASASFGVSVATAGDVNGDGFSDVIVGALAYDNGTFFEGCAFVYLGSASGLAASAAWTGESNQIGASFGASVATAGDVNGDGYSDVIVGAPNYDNGETNEGRAFVYHGSAGGLAASAAWTAESDQANSEFGLSVSTAGDLNGDGFDDVIVGAPDYDNALIDEGVIFLYYSSASGLSANWSVSHGGNQAGASFGASVATAGDVDGDGYSDVIVGAPLFDDGEIDEGRVSVYLGGTGIPSGTPHIYGNQAGAQFGSSVATAGDVNGDGYSDVIIGSPTFDNGELDEGRAFVHLGSAVGPATSAAWTTDSNQASARFGSSVATAGDVNGDGYSDVIVGAWLFDNGELDEGRAFTYLGSALGLASNAAWTAESNQSDASFGVSVSTAGDVNGDGYSDVIVGASRYDNGQSDEGRALVYMGSASGLATTAAWTAESDQADALFGNSVSTAGDVNGDGYSDVIVGAPFFDNSQSSEGRAYVYLGSASGLALVPAWTAESDQASAQLGTAVATAGDVNGDGFSDVILGAPFFDNGQTDEGRAFVYLGSAAGLSAAVAWTADGNQVFALFGLSAATAGDVNGDGYADVIVGAPYFDNGQTDEGRAFVFLGSASGLATTAVWTAESNQGGALFGGSVSTAADVNGDGYSDAIVGAVAYANGQVDEGRAYVYLGSVNGLSTSSAWTAESNQSDAYFGRSVSTAGDVNGDGYSDVIVGAYTFDNGHSDEGRAFVYLGSASGLATSASWTTESDQADANFGFSVATAGDVNGDGYSDVVIGADGFTNGQTDEGRAFVYFGNEGRGGWTLTPQQRRASDAAPIALLGRSHDENEFRIKLRFERELAGFSWASGVTPTARLEWQVRPLRAPLDGSAIGFGAAQTITGSPLTFHSLVEFVSASVVPLPFGIGHHGAAGAYHWRARVRTNNPLFPVTPWTTMSWNNVTETKLRVGPLPATRIAR